MLLAGQARAGDDDLGRVVRVLDGDSIIVKVNRESLEVRVYGIDCPEYDQPYGDPARKMTQRLTRGRAVRLHPRAVDRYGRLVARVELPKGDLSLMLLEAGLAWWYQRFAPERDDYRAAEKRARQARRGLWSQANPVPPWQKKAYRR